MAEYKIQEIRHGIGGLDLRRSADVVSQENALKLTNLVRVTDGAWTARPGQTSYATASGVHHSIRRAEDPIGGTSTRLWGVGSNLHRGASGALGAAIDTGYSGDPLSFVPWHPPQSGESWTIIGDRSRVRKVRTSDGLVLPVGLPAPSPATASLNALETLTVTEFESGFIPQPGTGGAPIISYGPSTAPNGSGDMMFYVVSPGAATSNYYNYAIQDFGAPADLSQFGSGADVEDEDFMHLAMLLQPAETASGIDTGSLIAIEIYVICSFGFGTTYLPGTNDAQNIQYYRAQIFFIDERLNPPFGNWKEFGYPYSRVVFPLRRSDFQLFGPNPETDALSSWNSIRGVCVQVHARFAPTWLLLPRVSLDGLYLQGGAGPDTTDNEPYTYKVTNYDPRTGAEGNGSTESSSIEPHRQGITVDPPAFGDAAVRQRIYRKGGTVNDNWHLVGTNASDGGTFVDTLNDDEITAAETVPIDHYQLVPTVDAAGATLLAQPVPYLWGPISGIVFAAGDKYRPGSVYWCKLDEIDHWGAGDFADVSGPSEKIIGGFVLGSQAFAWSTQRLYALQVSIGDVIEVTSVPTQCTRAPAAPWAFAVGVGFCVFCASDGVWVTDGGAEVNISDDWIRPLFRGETVNGYAPVDFTQISALRLEIYQNEVWVVHQDTLANNRALIYNLNDKQWRVYQFAKAVAVAYADTAPGVNQLLLGSTNASYQHSGFSDGGTAIAWTLRTPALRQEDPRSQKLYGDIVLDLDRQDVNITVTPYTDFLATAQPTLTLHTGSGRDLYRYNFSQPPLRSIDLSVELSGSSATARSLLYSTFLSYLHTPEDVQGRPTDLEVAGNLSTKIVKGIVIEANTYGVHKLVDVEVDGVVITTLDVYSTDRRVLEFSFATGEGHELRLVPTDHDVSWQLYNYQWIFDLEPLTLSRWETELINHQMPTWQIPVSAFVTLKSSASVTLQVTAYNQSGASTVKSYTIASTNGLKTNVFVPFEATKGILYKYLLTSASAFRLYREESHVKVVPWGGADVAMVPIFGNDDLDPSRGMGIASLAAAVPGGEAR